MLTPSIFGTNMDLTEAISQYAQERVVALEKLLESHGESVAVRVELGKSSLSHQHGPYFAEIHIEVPGKSLNAKVEDADLYAAIDKVKDDIKRQLVDLKEKDVANRHQPRPGKE